MYLVIGYTGYNWSLNARWFALVFMRFMITIYTKRIKFISLGFLSIYLARNKELAVFMGA